MYIIDNKKKLKNSILLISISVFIFSLTQKCFCTASNCGDSIVVLLFGFLGITTGGAAITWIANPALLISWIFIKKDLKKSLIASIVASTFAVSFLFFESVISDEAGHYSKIINYKIGYWLWLSSCLIMLIGNIIIRFFLPNNKKFI